MTGWDILDKIISNFSPIVATILLMVAAVIFIIGFSRRGFNFIKYGFGKIGLDETLVKRFDRLDERLLAIETNHFEHLKDYLTELNGILLDRNIINNAEKARLDSQLRGM
jgi:hypothetical protein